MSNLRPTTEMDVQLELKDRLNYPYLIQYSLMNLERSYSELEFDQSKTENIIVGLYNKIPNSWKDEEFTKDLKNKVITYRTIDIRPEFADTRLSIQYCKDNNIPTEKKVKMINFMSLQNAIINLIDRRGMLVRREKIEMTTGVNLDQTLGDLEKLELDAVEKLDAKDESEG